MQKSLNRGGDDLDDLQFKGDESLDETPIHSIPSNVSIIDRLPPEIIRLIFSYLSARELARVSATCRVLAEHGSDDGHWSRLVNSYLPFTIDDSGPFTSFRRLYLAHLPYWFIPQNKIWISDTEAVGGLILARYDHRRGVIEAYRIIADRRIPSFHIWRAQPDVMILSFEPEVSLWLDDPVLLLKDEAPSDSVAAGQIWNPDRRMPMAVEAQHVFSSLMLCPRDTGESDAQLTPSQFWPPPLIPASNHIPRTLHSRDTQLPSCASEVSPIGFRIKRWANFRLQPTDTETISNYATLDPELYTPTKEKPYQGIWVGDYSAHGCEFLLIYQQLEVVDSDASHDAGSEQVEMRNTLRAVKLTGDPNVPRGEITFTAADIGPKGFVRVAEEEPFVGARIVRSYGHVAGIGFRNGKYLRITSRCCPYSNPRPTVRLMDSITTDPHIDRLPCTLLARNGSYFVFPSRGYRWAVEDLMHSNGVRAISLRLQYLSCAFFPYIPRMVP